LRRSNFYARSDLIKAHLQILTGIALHISEEVALDAGGEAALVGHLADYLPVHLDLMQPHEADTGLGLALV